MEATEKVQEMLKVEFRGLNYYFNSYVFSGIKSNNQNENEYFMGLKGHKLAEKLCLYRESGSNYMSFHLLSPLGLFFRLSR